MNRKGTYFARLIAGGRHDVFGGNQLEFIIQGYNETGVNRRSLLQAATFDPQEDHTLSARVSFPCMQHVAFTRVRTAMGHGISLTAFYATQTLVERAYGNYLGLCQLGAFVSHEIDVPLVRVTCVAALARQEQTLKSLKHVLAVSSKVLQS